MGLRFRRSLRILPGVRLNLGKRGASVSVGARGALLTFGKRGTRATVGIPGTGLSYCRLEKPAQRVPQAPDGPGPAPLEPPGSAGRGVFWLLAILAVAAFMAWRPFR